MSFTYSDKKHADRTSPKAGTAQLRPSFDALRSGAAAPTAEQMGRRVDLPEAMRAKMENAFGADLSAVKLYESEAVADVGSNAITRGADIAFAPGLLDFSSFGGQALLGHEISHVVSQARGEVTGGGFLRDSALEARADREGAMAAAGETVALPTAAMSPVSAADAAGPMQAKEKPKKSKSPESDLPPDVAAFNAQQRQWHSMLNPAAQRYISDPLSMVSAPTATPAEMDRQVQQREQYYDIRTVKEQRFTDALRRKYNDPNATASSSKALVTGRRMEALYDPEQTPAADSYNQTMMDALDTLQTMEKSGGPAVMSDDLIAKMGTTLTPVVRDVLAVHGTQDDFMQYAMDNYSDSKFLSGKYHALTDLLKGFDTATKDRVIQAAGFTGSFDEFVGIAMPMTAEFSKGWVESGKAMGMGANLLFRGIEIATTNGQRQAGETSVGMAPPAPALAAAPAPKKKKRWQFWK